MVQATFSNFFPPFKKQKNVTEIPQSSTCIRPQSKEKSVLMYLRYRKRVVPVSNMMLIYVNPSWMSHKKELLETQLFCFNIEN